MKVKDLTETVVGKRILVTGIAIGEAERKGVVNDTELLMGQRGVATAFQGEQLQVAWEQRAPGRLMLCGDDEIEVMKTSGR